MGFFSQPPKRIPINLRPSRLCMAGGRCLLCAAGEWPSEKVWQPLVAASDCIIGVDGGTDIALSKNIEVSLALGDFDSILDQNVERIELPNQNRSDLLKSLDYAAKNSSEIVDVVGIEGGEIEHQLAAFAALIEAPLNLEVRLHLSGQIALRCLDTLEVILEEGTKISLFAFTACAFVSISGVQYPLDSEALAFSTLGLHNVALGGLVRIDSDGPLVVVIERGSD